MSGASVLDFHLETKYRNNANNVIFQDKLLRFPSYFFPFCGYIFFLRKQPRLCALLPLGLLMVSCHRAQSGSI